MTSYPQASIIVPVYNAQLWLHKCVDSLLDQIYPNIEIILVNDGSTDSSGLICQRYKQQCESVVYIEQANSGVSAARNTGLKRANGKYVLFVDSDDWVDSQYVESLVTEAERTHADYVLSGYVRRRVDAGTSDILCPKPTSFNLAAKDSEARLLDLFETRLLYSPSCGIYRKEIVVSQHIKFPEGVHVGEDRIFNLNYLFHSQLISSIAEAHYNYRIENTSSLSHIKFEDELLHTRRLFEANKTFLRAMQYESKGFMSWLYTPLFDAYSNRILRYASMYPEATWREIYTWIKADLRDPDLCDAYAYARLDEYAPLPVFLMKHQCALLLTLLTLINRTR